MMEYNLPPPDLNAPPPSLNPMNGPGPGPGPMQQKPYYNYHHYNKGFNYKNYHNFKHGMQVHQDDFDGKRLRKSVMRKTVDYNASIVKALEVSFEYH